MTDKIDAIIASLTETQASIILGGRARGVSQRGGWANARKALESKAILHRGDLTDLGKQVRARLDFGRREKAERENARVAAEVAEIRRRTEQTP